MEDDEANFTFNVKSPFIHFLQNIILWGVKILALLMVVVILWSVLDVFLLMIIKAKDPYRLITDMDEMLSIFGAFLVVLIAIEIFSNIILYLNKESGHLKLVIATAIMAIARKVIILDFDTAKDWHTMGMGILVLALGFAYWFVDKKNHYLQKKLKD